MLVNLRIDGRVGLGAENEMPDYLDYDPQRQVSNSLAVRILMELIGMMHTNWTPQTQQPKRRRSNKIGYFVSLGFTDRRYF